MRVDYDGAFPDNEGITREQTSRSKERGLSPLYKNRVSIRERTAKEKYLERRYETFEGIKLW